MTAKQVTIRRDSATNLNASTPADGELAYDTTNDQLRIGNGSTLGGVRLPNSIMLQNQTMVAATAGGTADAITVTLDPVPTAYATLMRVVFKATATNTLTTSTLNVNGLGAKTIKKKGTSGKIAIAVGDIQNGVIYAATYDGTDFQLETVASSGGGVVDYQTFTGNGTWTKPSSGTLALIQVWGGGASGGSRSTTGRASGGGGGAYNELLIPLALLGSTETVTVGAAAAGVSGNSAGTAGNNSTFGSWLTGYGGGAGTHGASSANGGAGGGRLSAGATTTNGSSTTATRNGDETKPGMPIEGVYKWDSTNSVNYYIPPAVLNTGHMPIYGGGQGGINAVNSGFAEASVYGGGGGGHGDLSGAGANSVYGGAGGGGTSSSTSPGSGGTSKYDGNGGAGGASSGAANGTAGTAPGGGGGGAVQGGTSGAGARGEVRVTVF